MHPTIAQHRTSIAAICQRYGIQRLEVFGSAARATDFDPAHSDADFLVEFAPGVEPGLHTIFGAKADLEALLKLAAAAVSRLQTHQLSSLAQTQVDANGNLLTTWQLELPMRHQQEVIPLQIKLQREDSGKADQPEHKETLWRVELAFDLDRVTSGTLGTTLTLQARNSLPNVPWLTMVSGTTGPTPIALIDPADTRVLSVGIDLLSLWALGAMSPTDPEATPLPIA